MLNLTEILVVLFAAFIYFLKALPIIAFGVYVIIKLRAQYKEINLLQQELNEIKAPFIE